MSLEYGSAEWRNAQRERQEKLNDCLKTLCDHEICSKEELEKTARSLLDVYSDSGFRHRYSDVFDVVHDRESTEQLDSSQRAQFVEARGDCLASGLRQLLTHKCDDTCHDVCAIHLLQRDSRLEKLYDHANLESRRAGYEYLLTEDTISTLYDARETLESSIETMKASTVTSSEATEAAREASEQAKSASVSAENAARVAAKAEKKAKRLQTEMISVLGIFSAITLAFNASVTYTTSAIAAADVRPPFDIAFIVAIVGFILFNCLYGAFALIYRIIRPDGSPDRLLGVHRVVGIELVSISVCFLLGTLAFCYGDGRLTGASSWAVMAFFMLLAFGVRHLLWPDDVGR